MTDLRDMELLAALAEHRHFARAAESCGISQPAFSARIRNFEIDLGVPVVNRGNRFQGFTPEGEIALRWAHRMIADADALRQEIAEAREGLTGTMTLGTVPTALAYAARIAAEMRVEHPRLMIRVVSQSSREIAHAVGAFSIDAGVTYLDAEPPQGTRAVELYMERYEVLLPRRLADEGATLITWASAARLPLCLLTSNMRNRQIVDEAFAAAGAIPNLVMETNAFTASLTQVLSGTAATIVPQGLATSMVLPDHVVRLGLIDPLVEKPIGALLANREPALPAVRALLAMMERLPR